MHANRTGAVLLEVIVATVIFSTAALAAVALVRDASAAVDHAHQVDDRIQSASHLLDVVSLWPREDLDRHLGERHEGAWILRVDRPLPALYRVAVYDSTNTLVLETAVFRKEVVRAQP